MMAVSVALSGCGKKDVLGRPSESPTLMERVTKEKVTGKVVDVVRRTFQLGKTSTIKMIAKRMERRDIFESINKRKWIRWPLATR
jgi:hypothetical protein